MAISSALGSSALLPAGLGFRNVLINGDFKVWQRGTSKAMATASGTGYLADRWTAARAGYAAGGTVARYSASLDGFQYCSRVQRDSGNTSTAVVYYFQTLESVTSIPLANKPVVYSFYIRSGANLSGSVVAKLYSGTATDGQNYPDASITGSATVITSTLSLTTTWQRVILYGNVASTATQLFVGFEWTPSGTAGTNDYFEITGVQVEQNSQPTPFEQRPIGTELALCQRYYQRFTSSSGGPGIFCMGMFGGGTSSSRNILHFHVPMRTLASSVDFSAANTFWLNAHNIANYTLSSISYNAYSGDTSDALEIYATPSSSAGAAGTAALLVAANATAYIGVNAEL